MMATVSFGRDDLASECPRCAEIDAALVIGARATCDRCGADHELVRVERERPRTRKPVRVGSPRFRALESATVIDMTSIAAYRSIGSAPSSWIVPAPPTSLEADVFTGKIVPRGRALTDGDREWSRDRGRVLNHRYEALRDREEAAALAWLVESGGALAATQKPLLEAIGWGLATARQRKAWRAAGDVIGQSEEHGRTAWGPAVGLWCSVVVT